MTDWIDDYARRQQEETMRRQQEEQAQRQQEEAMRRQQEEQAQRQQVLADQARQEAADRERLEQAAQQSLTAEALRSQSLFDEQVSRDQVLADQARQDAADRERLEQAAQRQEQWETEHQAQRVWEEQHQQSLTADAWREVLAEAQTIRQDVADSVAHAETRRRYDLVHDDSARINFGIGSWTGTRIASVLQTYVDYAEQQGLTPQLMDHFDGEANFNAIVERFQDHGTSTVLTPAEREMLSQLGADQDLQQAQDLHLASDIREDLQAIAATPYPSVPFNSDQPGGISELASHVLVHARHQTGGTGFNSLIREVVNDFGGNDRLQREALLGSVTERDFLDHVAERVVDRVRPEYRNGVRERYQNLFDTYGDADATYFTPLETSR